MTMIAYSSPYVPAELIVAYGLTPGRIMPGSATLSGPIPAMAGTCPYMRAFVNSVCETPGVEAIILATVCDQMRRAGDYVEQYTKLPLCLLNVPSTWQTPEAVRLYISELRRLGCFLEELGGRPPAPQALWTVMESFNRKREQLVGLRGLLPALDFSRAVAGFGSTGGAVVPDAGAGVNHTGREGSSLVSGRSGVPLAFLGGPLSCSDFELFDIVRLAGGDVVLDGTETGERTLPAPFNRRHAGSDDPFEELAAAYFGHIPDVFSRPNSELYKWLGREVESRGIRGVIVLRQVWCDKWHAEVARLKAWLKIPVVDLDLDGEAAKARNACRIQAFVEGLL